jgi:hypothetical protein
VSSWKRRQLNGNGVADLEDDFKRETFGFTFKIIPLFSNAMGTEVNIEASNVGEDRRKARRAIA